MDGDDVFQVAQIQKKALARMEQGSKTYGEFKPEEDERCLYDEAIAELLDCMNYCAMQIVKLQALRNR